MTLEADLGASAAPREITHAGKTYAFGRLTLAGMTAFTSWFVGRLRATIIDLYAHDPEEQRRQLGLLQRESVEGAFQFGEEAIMGRRAMVPETRVIDGREVRGLRPVIRGGALSGVEGQAKLLSILCGCDPEEALALMLARQQEVGHLIGVALAESLGRPAPAANDGGDGWLPEGVAAAPKPQPPPA